MIETLFIDLDDTILDFHQAEHVALQKTLESFGIEPTGEICQRYSQINRAHWEMLERKELTREEVLVGRFATLFRELGAEADAALCAARYGENLSQGHYFMPGAYEAIQKLFGKYRMYIASNGTKRVQEGRLKSAKIGHFFEDIFISQDLKANKPDKAFFDACFERIPDFCYAESMIVGDSLTSDILGGINAGITTCWVNPQHKPPENGIRPDYEIESLSQLPDLLESL